VTDAYRQAIHPQGAYRTPGRCRAGGGRVRREAPHRLLVWMSITRRRCQPP